MAIQYMALNKATNDLYKSTCGGIHRVSEGRFVIQQVSCKLKTILNEWILDKTVGYLNLDDLGRNKELFDLEVRLTDIVTSTQGVNKILSVDFDLKDRSLKIDFKAETIYGEIDTSVPWADELVEYIDVLPDLAEVLTHLGVPVTHNGIAVTVGSGGLNLNSGLGGHGQALKGIGGCPPEAPPTDPVIVTPAAPEVLTTTNVTNSSTFLTSQVGVALLEDPPS